MTVQHSWNLGRFVAIYKAVLIALQRVAREERPWHAFCAGSVGGYLIFSQDNPVNNQVTAADAHTEP